MFWNVVLLVYSYFFIYSGSLKSGIYLYSNDRLDVIYLIIRNCDKRCVIVLKKNYLNKKFIYCVYFQFKNIILFNVLFFGYILIVVFFGIKVVMFL